MNQCFHAECQNKGAFKFTWPWGQEAHVCGDHQYAVAQTCGNMGYSAPALTPVVPPSASERAHAALARVENLLERHANVIGELHEMLTELKDAAAMAEDEQPEQEPASTSSPAPSEVS